MPIHAGETEVQRLALLRGLEQRGPDALAVLLFDESQPGYCVGAGTIRAQVVERDRQFSILLGRRCSRLPFGVVVFFGFPFQVGVLFIRVAELVALGFRAVVRVEPQ